MDIMLRNSYFDQMLLVFNLNLTNAPDPFKSAPYERTKWVRCGHLNSPHSHVEA